MGFRIEFNSQLMNRSRRMKIAVQMRKGLNGVFLCADPYRGKAPAFGKQPGEPLSLSAVNSSVYECLFDKKSGPYFI